VYSVASGCIGGMLLLGLAVWAARKRRRRNARAAAMAAMRARLLKRFPQLAGIEGVFTDEDGIGEWLIPFGDIEVMIWVMVWARADAVALFYCVCAKHFPNVCQMCAAWCFACKKGWGRDWRWRVGDGAQGALCRRTCGHQAAPYHANARLGGP